MIMNKSQVTIICRPRTALLPMKRPPERSDFLFGSGAPFDKFKIEKVDEKCILLGFQHLKN
jgi:hypothetical protein